MVSKVVGAIGIVLAVIVIGATGLAAIKGSASSDLRNENLLAKAALEKPEEFIKCKSTKTFSTDVFNVTMSYLPFDVSDDERARVLAVQTKFEDQFNAKCDPIIKAFEDNFETYKRTSNEIAQAEMSFFDKLIGYDPTIPDSEFAAYNPSLVFMRGGSAASNMLFTRSDVEAFYERELGH